MIFVVYDTVTETIVYEHERRGFCEMMKQRHYPSDRFRVQEKCLVPESYSDYWADFRAAHSTEEVAVV